MLRLLKQMKAKQWIMALLCVALILGQIYFDLRLPDYMERSDRADQNAGQYRFGRAAHRP